MMFKPLVRGDGVAGIEVAFTQEVRAGWLGRIYICSFGLNLLYEVCGFASYAVAFSHIFSEHRQILPEQLK